MLTARIAFAHLHNVPAHQALAVCHVTNKTLIQFLELVTTNHRSGFHRLEPFKNISLLVSSSPLESYQMMCDIPCKRLCTYTWYESMFSTFAKPKNSVNGLNIRIPDFGIRFTTAEKPLINHYGHSHTKCCCGDYGSNYSYPDCKPFLISN